ncbi:hypothetical protein [Actinacidiphila bryophytorum]|uniref:hypothetical protein n=1 Tax=Actinacidiphila bryophytorum TaxID=1436133 RepID=UPI002176D1B3|nr:hypothetical protein [Actinacidiphila bryophytorum]UWE11112.1 hypothetical protein NYE86_21920 [Actinacidiphila bryophytorum]
MKTALSRSFAVGLLALAFAATGAGGDARAATAVPVSAPGTYASDPSSTPSGAKTTRSLGGTVQVPAGSTRYLSSKLYVDDAAQVTEVSHMIYCKRPGESAVSAQLVSGQNALANTPTTMLTRGFVTAPADAALTCSVYAQFVNHAADSAGSITVLASSYLQDVDGDIGAVRQAFSTSMLVNSSANVDTVAFTAPAAATAVQAIGDVSVTVCYGADGGLCRRSSGARMDGTSSYVGTQLVLNQLNSDGSVCRTTTNGALKGTTVTTTVHHYRINTWLTDVPVDPACTSRDFVSYTRTTANANSNSFKIEANNQTVGAVFVP